MFRLGITGGIGSGKTTVCKIFEQYGVPVYYADLRSKVLVSENSDLQRELIQEFGQKTFVDGEYNRAYIASIVFNDKSRLNVLNSIIHPYVLKDWDSFCIKHRNHAYVIKEAAIMLETDSKNSIDSVVLVYAPEELRIQRIMKRDSIDLDSIKARINSQMPEEEKLKLANHIIYNDGEHSLIEQVKELHLKYNEHTSY
ncbi:MAG: dephospho-CoA kinase [Bacteroidia bacterium]